VRPRRDRILATFLTERPASKTRCRMGEKRSSAGILHLYESNNHIVAGQIAYRQRPIANPNPSITRQSAPELHLFQQTRLRRIELEHPVPMKPSQLPATPPPC